MFRKLNNRSSLMVLVVVLGGLALAAGSALFVWGLDDAQAAKKNSSTPGIVATLPVGEGPDNIRAIAATDRIYVSNFNDHTVSIIDGTTDAVITKVTIAGLLADDTFDDLEVSSFSNLVYVMDRAGVLSVFDGATNTDTLLGFVNLGERLDDIIFTANNRVYINHANTGKVTVFDDGFPLELNGGPVLTLDSFEGGSRFIIANPATDHVFVLHSGSVTVIDNSLTPPAFILDAGFPLILPVGASPRRLRFNPNTDHFFVPNRGDGTFSVIDDSVFPPAVLGPFGAGTKPDQLNIDTVLNKVYLLNRDSANVTVIDDDGGFGTTTVGVGASPGRVRINSGTGRAYVANFDSNSVSVIDTVSDLVVATIPVGMRPDRLQIDRTANLIYVSNRSGDTVTIIDGGTNSVIATLPVGSFPSRMTLTSANGKVYITNRDSDTVSVIADVITQPFTNQSLDDSWGFSASGIGPPFTEVGIMTFDGSGGCNVTSTLNTVGTVTGPRDSDTCTYSMSPNGTGSIAVQFSGDVFPELLVFAILERKTAEKKKADAQEMTFIGLGADGLRGSATRR